MLVHFELSVCFYFVLILRIMQLRTQWLASVICIVIGSEQALLLSLHPGGVEWPGITPKSLLSSSDRGN